MASAGFQRARLWTLAVLVLLGALVQACTDNKGPAGPSSAVQTGHADTAAQIVVQVAINPGLNELGKPVGITVLVTNTNGRPLAGRTVQLSTTLGKLRIVDGITDAAGKFVSSLTVTTLDVANAAVATTATVTAFVEGAVGSNVVNFPSNVALTILPTTTTVTLRSVGGSCTTAVAYTVSGGVPPYTVTTALTQNSAPGVTASISGSGNEFTLTVTIPANFTLNPINVIARDDRGATVTASVNFTCN